MRTSCGSRFVHSDSGRDSSAVPRKRNASPERGGSELAGTRNSDGGATCGRTYVRTIVAPVYIQAWTRAWLSVPARRLSKAVVAERPSTRHGSQKHSLSRAIASGRGVSRAVVVTRRNVEKKEGLPPTLWRPLCINPPYAVQSAHAKWRAF
jgi:hypothetical protein